MKHRTNIYLEPGQIEDLNAIIAAEADNKKLNKWSKFIRQAIDVAIVKYKMRRGKPDEEKT